MCVNLGADIENIMSLARQLSFLPAESDTVYVEGQGRNILFILHVKLCFKVNLHSFIHNYKSPFINDSI